MARAITRDNIRAELNVNRQLNRDKMLFIRRKALNDVINLGRDVTDSEVIMVGNKLKMKSAIQVDDLALLKLACVQSSKNIVTFLKVKGALHALVRELSSNKASFQLVAAECCCNLALGDARSCLQVAKAAGPYLTALLNGCNHNLTNVSVWALGNLAGSDEKTWKIVHSQGFLGKLLQLIQENDTSSDLPVLADLQYNLYSALVQMLRIGSTLLTSEEVESTAKAVAAVRNTAVRSLRVCEYLLSSMAAAEPALIQGQVHIKSLSSLQSGELNDENIVAFTAALRTIGNLVAEPSGTCALQVFSHWKLFQEVVQKIFAAPYQHLVRELGWLLGNLWNHSSPEVQTALDSAQLSFDFQIYESQFAFFSK